MNRMMIYKLATFVRNGAGGSPVYVVVEPTPLPDAARQALTRELGLLTAFVPADTPDPLPVAFYDPHGEQAYGEQALIAVFRAMALEGRTVARRIRLETLRGVVPVQEEVFRKPTQAQVWIELELPVVTRWSEPLLELLGGLELPEASAAWGAGGTVLIDAGSLALARDARLEPDRVRGLLPEGMTDLLVYSLETVSPLSDVYVRHVAARGVVQERVASVEANAALGVLLWQEGRQQTFLSLEQGADAGSPSRVSVWIEGEGSSASRVSVGGQVLELERFERGRAEESA